MAEIDFSAPIEYLLSSEDIEGDEILNLTDAHFAIELDKTNPFTKQWNKAN